MRQQARGRAAARRSSSRAPYAGWLTGLRARQAQHLEAMVRDLGADVLATDADGRTAIHYAAAAGQVRRRWPARGEGRAVVCVGRRALDSRGEGRSILGEKGARRALEGGEGRSIRARREG